MLVEHSGGIALRQGNWKYIPAQPQANGPRAKQLDRIQPATPELYDLSKDIGERQNVIAANAERAEAMRAALEKIKG
jgi:hypothetical protein